MRQELERQKLEKMRAEEEGQMQLEAEWQQADEDGYVDNYYTGQASNDMDEGSHHNVISHQNYGASSSSMILDRKMRKNNKQSGKQIIPCFGYYRDFEDDFGDDLD